MMTLSFLFKNWKIILIGVLIAALLMFIHLYRHEAAQKSDLKEILTNQSKPVVITRLKDSTYVTKSVIDLVTTKLAVALTLKNDSSLKAFAKELHIHNNQIKSLRKTNISTSYNIKQQLKDSIILDTVHVKVFKFKDRWLTVTGEIVHDSLIYRLHTIDSLSQIGHFKRNKIAKWFFGGIGLGSKVYYNEIRSNNPHTIIVYDKEIEVK